MQEPGQQATWYRPKLLAIAGAFGAAAYVLVWSGLTLPIPGTLVSTDPREIPVLIGAALTGPLGGVIIGICAGLFDPLGLQYIGITNHVLAGLWLGWAYKKLVFERTVMPLMLVGWVGLVLINYCLILAPLIILLVYLTPGLSAQIFGATASPASAWAVLMRGLLPELLSTVLVTTTVLWALPRRYRRPLW